MILNVKLISLKIESHSGTLNNVCDVQWLTNTESDRIYTH